MTFKSAQRTHTDRAFEHDLEQLRVRLSQMAVAVERQISAAMKALADQDAALAHRVVDGDVEVNRRELEIDELCRRILALRQPAASDLRLITTAIKIVTDLERIGDQAVNIAERTVDLGPQAPPVAGLDGLLRLASAALAQLHRALRAFLEQDAGAAEEVMHGDLTVDALFRDTFNSLLALMMEDSRNIRRATALMFVARHLERIGDHATNIAEMTVYLVRGTDVRHPLSRAVIGH